MVPRLPPDTPGHLHAVHVRHEPIDEVDLVLVLPVQGLTGAEHRLPPGEGPLRAHPDLPQHPGDAVADVEVVVHHQGVAALELPDDHRLPPLLLEAEAQAHRELRPLPGPALYRDGPAHEVDDVLGDGHAQAGALDAADGGGALPLKGLEDAGEEVLAHADARVLHGEDVACEALPLTGLLHDAHGNLSAGAGKFHGVAQEVQKHLVQPELVAVDVLVAHVHGVDAQRQALGGDLGVEDIAQLAPDLRQAARVLLNVDLAALDAAHVQNIVDEPQQVVAGGHDLPQILPHPLPLVDVLEGQGGEADDGVHGGADVMAHVGEEGALGDVGPLGLGQGGLQLGALLELPLNGIRDHPFGQDHLGAPRLPGHPGEAELDILHLLSGVVADGDVVDLPVPELRQHRLHRRAPPPGLPVLLVDVGGVGVHGVAVALPAQEGPRHLRQGLVGQVDGEGAGVGVH